MKEKITTFGKIQDNAFFARKYYVIRGMTIVELHQFDVVILIFFNMLNWRVLSDSQDEKIQPEFVLDFLYLNCRFVLFCHLVMHHYTSIHKKRI